MQIINLIFENVRENVIEKNSVVMHNFILCVNEEYRLSLLTASSVNTGTAGVLVFLALSICTKYKYNKNANVRKCKIGNAVLNIRTIDITLSDRAKKKSSF